MFISKVMTRNVVTIDKSADISAAQEKMAEHHIRHLPVVEENNLLIGIVTDRDIRSALPSSRLTQKDNMEKITSSKINGIMTKNPVSISPLDTIQDALILLQKKRFGSLPVVDHQGKLIGIITTRDLFREFINVLGLEDPGTLLCLLVEDKIGQMKKIVDAVSEEKISFGSILVSRYWEEGKRAVFPYLLTQNIGPLKTKLKNMGYSLLDPLDWYRNSYSEDK
ncbi:MAG: CBS domain-containing protein [Desulfobacterales bacterium]